MSRLFQILLCLSALTIAHTAVAELKLAATVASDYVHRGLSHVSEGVAVQGLVEYDFAGGWYLGLWATNLEFDRPGDRDFEVDYFLGYQRRVSPRLALDVTLIHYSYPGQNELRNYDWQELIASAYLGERWLVSLGVGDNWWAADEQSAFAELGYRYPLPAQLSLDVTLGWQASPQPFPNYGYGELGLSRQLGPLDFRVAYSATEDAAKQLFRGLAKDRWIVSLTYNL